MAERTLVFYYPYADGLQGFIDKNIVDMKTVITTLRGTPDQHVMVIFATSPTSAELYELVYQRGQTSKLLRQKYEDIHFRSATDLERMLQDVVLYAPARSYSMVIGAHGLGWVPAADAQAPARCFGGLTTDTRMEIEDFAEVLRRVPMPLDFLLFDCCYMATVETCYALRDVTRYIIASTSELFGPGMPYSLVGQYLLGEPNYKAILTTFDSYYSHYQTPCGTLSLIDTRGLEPLADYTRTLYAQHYEDVGFVRQAQVLDGYSPPLFYDFEDCMLHLQGLDDAEKNELHRLIVAAVPYCVHTPTYYSDLIPNRGQHTIRTFCGLTTSAPSYSKHAAHWSSTEWAQSVH